MKKIAIQGGVASFHDIATRKFFEGDDLEVVPCQTFEKVAQLVKEGTVDYGLMAIENSIAGSILLNYSLIEKYELFICGEYKLRIKHNLMALKGQKPADIKKVRSHYMALIQCSEFLEKHPEWEVEEYYDTADSAKLIKEKGLEGQGAIAGDLAAEIYGLDVLEESVETIKLNYTRFLVLSKSAEYQPNEVTDKATISFELSDANEVGALAKTLQIVVKYKLNLTKIQSVPIIGKPDRYTFYIDCMWSDRADMMRCMVELRQFIHKITVLGEYKNYEIEDDYFSSRTSE
jgi:prephenate dehydratase